ncbi:formate/nitrite transporter family protein [Inediibacterium massiliense]|uniref:formate/nitrite transporter family protein n=1 Tax=Inediibacterium massiliense TaxID=1658111 RepID=UPI0006B4814D|nr:formate/nitrite transporter family protein [Inediibacterium massiliense]
MSNTLLSPKEIAQGIIQTGITKTKLSYIQMVGLSILAGIYIGFGGFGAITISQRMSSIDVGLSKVLFSMIFPIGLMLVVTCGAELFTGNHLMSLGVLSGEYSMKKVLRNWIVVYAGNFIGSILFAQMIFYSGLTNGPIKEILLSLSVSKINIPVTELILRGILCNMLVVLAIWMGTGAKDLISKLFACWAPIMLFVLCGFEHSIANMFFIPMGKFLGSDISWMDIWFHNIIPVTIGNLLGGALMIPIFYFFIYIKNDAQKTSSSS